MNIKQLVSHASAIGALIVAPLALSACNGSDPIGDLIVPFEVGVVDDCEKLGVVDVRVTLSDMPPDGDVSAPIESVTVPCMDKQAVFNNLPVGDYYIGAEGLDASGVVVTDNDGTALTDIGEVLEGQESTAAPVPMYPTPAQLLVRFTLFDVEEMFAAMCNSVVVTDFQITAAKDGGAAPLLMAKLPCTAMPDTGSYHTIADPGRDLEGSTFDFIKIQPKDATNNNVGAAAIFPLEKVVGAGRQVKVTVTAECTADKCDLKCPGDACVPD